MSTRLTDPHAHGAHSGGSGTVAGALHHHPALQHHFDNLEQQKESSTLGMWLFLVTEIMFFGGLFTVYIIYRSRWPEAFEAASHHLDVSLGLFNTAILIGSSLTMAMSIWAAQVNRRKLIVVFLIATIALGLIFLGVKSVEYSHKFHDNLVPGPNFHWDGPEPEHVEVFYSLYFIMTGLHAVHMIIGIGVLAALIVFARKGRYDSSYYNPLECTGLYWHFVDLVWIFLFPLLYLLGAHAR